MVPRGGCECKQYSKSAQDPPNKRKKASVKSAEQKHTEKASEMRQQSHATCQLRFEATAQLKNLADGRVANGDASMPPPSKKQRSDGALL